MQYKVDMEVHLETYRYPIFVASFVEKTILIELSLLLYQKLLDLTCGGLFLGS